MTTGPPTHLNTNTTPSHGAVTHLPKHTGREVLHNEQAPGTDDIPVKDTSIGGRHGHSNTANTRLCRPRAADRLPWRAATDAPPEKPAAIRIRRTRQC